MVKIMMVAIRWRFSSPLAGVGGHGGVASTGVAFVGADGRYALKTCVRVVVVLCCAGA